MRDELFSVPISRGKSIHFVMDEKVKTPKYRVNGGTWSCATHVNERPRTGSADEAIMIQPQSCFRLSSPHPAKRRPVHAWRVMTIRLGCRLHWRAGATAEASGQCLRRSSVPTREDSSRFRL